MLKILFIMGIETVIKPAAMKFGISMHKSKVEVYYQNKEISEYLHMGFVPYKESLSRLESRTMNSLANWLEKTTEEGYEHIPEALMQSFNQRFGLDMTERMLFKKTSRKYSMLNKFVAAYAYNEDNVGIIECSTKEGKKNLNLMIHEMLHHVFSNNPFLINEVVKHKKSRKFDKDYLPIPYHPLDKTDTFGEALPEGFNHSTIVVAPLPFIPSLGELSLSVLSGALGMTGKTFALFNPDSGIQAFFANNADYMLLPMGYVAMNIGAKLPRSLVNIFRYQSYKKKIKKLRYHLGDSGAIKLMQVSGPKELKHLCRLAEKL